MEDLKYKSNVSTERILDVANSQTAFLGARTK